MDTAIVISTIALAVSILGTLASVFYTRRRNKIMEAQLDIVRKDADRKKALERVSATIGEVIDTIREKTDHRHFFLSPLDISKDDILAYMHDNQMVTLSISIKPKSISYVEAGHGVPKVAETKVEDLKEITDQVTLILAKNISSFQFNCDPKILQNNFVELGDPLDAIKALYDAYNTLESCKDTIDAFDPNLLRGFKYFLDTIVRTIFEAVTHTHTLVFASSDKSEEILRKLENQIFDLESIKGLLNRLSVEIVTKLSEIRKEIYLK